MSEVPKTTPYLDRVEKFLGRDFEAWVAGQELQEREEYDLEKCAYDYVQYHNSIYLHNKNLLNHIEELKAEKDLCSKGKSADLDAMITEIEADIKSLEFKLKSGYERPI